MQYKLRERYWKKEAIEVDASVTIQHANLTQLEERVTVSAAAHMQYTIQLGYLDPILYAGTLCNVKPLWTPAVLRFTSSWFDTFR